MRFMYAMKIDSARPQRKDDRLFKKLVKDVYKRISKSDTWEYLPSEAHLKYLLDITEFDIEFMLKDDWISVRRHRGE